MGTSLGKLSVWLFISSAFFAFLSSHAAINEAFNGWFVVAAWSALIASAFVGFMWSLEN